MNKIYEEIKNKTAGVEGWLSLDEGAFLYETAKRMAKLGAVVEVGSWKGKSTIWLAYGVRDGGGKRVYAIDPHTGAPEHHEIFKTKDIWTFDQFKKNIAGAGVSEYIEPIVDRSENVSRRWKEPVAFMWIDGAHAYDAAKMDFEAWFPLVVDGGIIAYHDATYDDVRRVVNEKILHSRTFKDAGIVGTIVFARKVSPAQQQFFDRIRNHYVSLLITLHSLRRLPLPPTLRRIAKSFFRRFLRIAQ